MENILLEKNLNEAWDPKTLAKQDAEFAWETGFPMDPAEWENDDKKNIMTEYDFTEEQAEAYKNFYWDYYYICMAGDPYNDDDLDENLTETKATGARGRYQVEVFDEGDWHKLNSWSTIEKATKAGEAAVEAVYQDYRIIDKETNNEVELDEALTENRLNAPKSKDLTFLANEFDKALTKSNFKYEIWIEDDYKIAVKADDLTAIDAFAEKHFDKHNLVPDIEDHGEYHCYKLAKKDVVQEEPVEEALNEESEGDLPFTKEQVYDELKRETDNWEVKEDTFRYFYESEKDFAMEILSKHYECEYAGTDEDGWHVIHFWKQNLNKSFTTERYAYYEDEEAILKEDTQRYSFDTSAKKAERIKLQLKKKNIKCIIDDYRTSGKYFDYGDEDEELDGDVNYALVIVGVDYDDIDEEIEELTDNYPSIYIYDTVDPDRSDLPNYVYEVYNRNSDCFTTNNTIEAINKAIDFLQLTNESLIEAKNISKEHNKVTRIINDLLYAYSSDTHYGKSVSYNSLLKEKYDAKNDSGEFLVNMSFRPNPKVSINYKEGEAEKILFDSVNLFKNALESELEELGFTNYIIETLQDTLHVAKNDGNNPVVAKFKGSVLSANIHVRILVDYFKDLEEHFAVDTHDQLDEEEIKPIIEIKPVNESLEERKSAKKFEAGSEKTFTEDSEEYKQLEKAADKLTNLSVKNYKYFVGNTYLDFGSGWQWTTILAKKPNEVEYQVLSPLDWRNIMNAQSEEELDAAIAELRSDKYFQDKVKEPDMNSSDRDVFDYLNSIED